MMSTTSPFCLQLTSPSSPPLPSPSLQLGGKGANLCEMAKWGLDVPPGFTITTEVCQEFYRCGGCKPH